MEFENAMTRLSEIVTRLESADLTLEDSIKLYEEGMKLHKICQDSLSKAERKVYILKSGADQSSTNSPAKQNPPRKHNDDLNTSFSLFDSP